MDDTILSPDQLTAQETEILKRLADGLSDKEIAGELSLSLNTIKWYNRQIYSKLGVSSRSQAISHTHHLQLLKEKKSSALDFPPGQSLPAELNRFIGREHASAEIDWLLQNNRLVTVVGPPGTGKTRLSIHVAREAAGRFRDGVFFIPLGPVQAADHILWAIAEHLAYQFRGSGDPLREILKFLSDKQLLLVLDNFEHLIAGRGLLAEILLAAPAVKCLVTSRERLGLYGEVGYVLGGMALPDDIRPESVMQSEAVELFIERTQSANPNLTWKPDELAQVIRICRLVDGMPLGIELAATWMDTLILREIADEIEYNLDILQDNLQNTPYSHSSIRAAFDRSWNLLDEKHRSAFRRVSVFRGGFTREAVAAVAGVDLHTLRGLVNKSLLRHHPETGRYDTHELLRHYAGEMLEQSGEAKAICQAHAAYFADFMAERWNWMKDRRQKTALMDLESDIDNIRAAWHYWIQAGDVRQIQKFLHSFWAIYDVRGWYPAGIELFGQTVKVMRSSPDPEARICLGWLLAVQGLYSVPVTEHDQSLLSWSIHSLLYYGHGLYTESDSSLRQGLDLTLEGIQILRSAGQNDEMMIIPLISLFNTASQIIGEDILAVQATEECLKVATRINDRWAIAKAKQFLAVRAIEDVEYSKAECLAREAYSVFEESGNNWSLSVVCIEVLGLVGIMQKQFESAIYWIEKGLKAAEEIDFKYSMQMAYWQLGYIAALEEKYMEAGAYWTKALGVSSQMLGGRSFIGLGSADRARKLFGKE